jgi:hypothetical protein
MATRQQHIALLTRGITRELTFCAHPYRIDAFVFLNMSEVEARFDIAEMAWQDRAEWVGMRPFRVYPGWPKQEVIAMEELLKEPDVENVYIEF